LGFVGLPVMSGFQGGPAKIIGPTGGYLIGFIPMAILCGLFFQKYYKKVVLCVLVMEASTWIAYIMGSLWLSFQAKMTIPAAFAAGVFPFALEDFLKMVIAGILGPVLVKALAPLGLNLPENSTKAAA
ncbi:MAG: biotin transporter BioY, partial [Lachnospiraceae bacterium]|nr:biotin transporter BioY [Lachnospiraceae bacterium]